MNRDDLKKVFDSLPVLPCRQDSLTDQLDDLWKVASRLGMTDAADMILKMVRNVSPIV